MSDPRYHTSTNKWLWLSHTLGVDTPSYGGGPGLVLTHEKSLCAGNSCNTARLDLSNHLGSHVDAPLHFIANGPSVDEYAPSDWIFSRPVLIDVPLDGPVLITPELLSPLLGNLCTTPAVLKNDLLLIRTGFERWRQEERFWKEGPGLAASLAPWLQEKFPHLQAIGVDCISISSFQHRDEGRIAHRALLGKGLRLFEDLALAALPHQGIERVIALPLRLHHGDGAPCTIVAEIANSAPL